MAWKRRSSGFFYLSGVLSVAVISLSFDGWLRQAGLSEKYPHCRHMSSVELPQDDGTLPRTGSRSDRYHTQYQVFSGYPKGWRIR